MSASIHNDQTHDTLLPRLLPFSVGSWSQSSGNIEDKTTTFLDSAVSTGSRQGLRWPAFQGYAPGSTPQATKHTSWAEAAQVVQFKPVLCLPPRWGC